jgi:hypothetical protein
VELKNPKKEKNKVLRSEKKVAIMFPGMFMRKPDKAVALKQLKSHVAMFGTWVLVILDSRIHGNLSPNYDLKF